MPLTAAQKATFKTDILANTATIPAGQPWTGSFAGVQVKDVPNDGDGNFAVAGFYSAVVTPDWFVWRDLPMDVVLNLVTLASMTASAAVGVLMLSGTMPAPDSSTVAAIFDIMSN